MRVIALITGLLLFACTQAATAEEAKKLDAAPGSSVEMPYLIAPLSSDGTLLAYAYVSCKIVGANPAAALQIRSKVPFIQDAFVRDVNASSIGKPGDPMAVDKLTLEPRLLALVKKVMGPGKVVDLKLMQVQITPMRPGSSAVRQPALGIESASLPPKMLRWPIRFGIASTPLKRWVCSGRPWGPASVLALAGGSKIRKRENHGFRA